MFIFVEVSVSAAADTLLISTPTAVQLFGRLMLSGPERRRSAEIIAMPRFFFDVDDGEHRFQDDEGVELADDQEARTKAISVLPDIAREVVPEDDRRAFVSKVRDATGRTIFMATLSFVAKWL